MDDERLWAYLAGFTDGDGCISLETSKGTYRYSRIRWAQKESDSAVLDWVAAFLAGQDLKVTLRNFSVSTRGHRYPQRELAVTNGADTRVILQRLLPYLIVKRDRALAALAILNKVHDLKALYGNKYRIHCTSDGGSIHAVAREYPRRMTADLANRVMTAHAAAKRSKLPVIREIATTFNISDRTASRWIGQARALTS
jgi:hypothetical protein